MVSYGMGFSTIHLFLCLIPRSVSFLSIVWCSRNGDHLQEDLAKFGYKQDMKIKKIQASFYIAGYLLKHINSFLVSNRTIDFMIGI
jgi:hypothetical protein